MSGGFRRSVVEGCAFCNDATEVFALIHGDDTFAIGERESLKDFVAWENARFVGKACAIVSAHVDDAKALRFLKREIRCLPEFEWEMEADAKHAEAILEKLVSSEGPERSEAQ